MHSRTSLGTTDELKTFLSMLKVNGCTCKLDRDAGTADAKDGHYTVLMAIQKGRGGPWIMRFMDSPRIQWVKSDGPPPVQKEPEGG